MKSLDSKSSHKGNTHQKVWAYSACSSSSRVLRQRIICNSSSSKFVFVAAPARVTFFFDSISVLSATSRSLHPAPLKKQKILKFSRFGVYSVLYVGSTLNCLVRLL